MAPHELAESRRQDVVGEVADVRVAEHPAVRHVLDRLDECLPPGAAGRDVEETRADHHQDPGRVGRSQDLDRPRRGRPSPSEDPDGDAADGDAEDRSEERLPAHRSVAASSIEVGARRVRRAGRQLRRAPHPQSMEEVAGDHPQRREAVDDAPLEADRARLLEIAGRARRSRRSDGACRRRRPAR